VGAFVDVCAVPGGQETKIIGLTLGRESHRTPENVLAAIAVAEVELIRGTVLNAHYSSSLE